MKMESKERSLDFRLQQLYSDVYLFHGCQFSSHYAFYAFLMWDCIDNMNRRCYLKQDADEATTLIALVAIPAQAGGLWEA